MLGVAFYIALFFTCIPFVFLCVRTLRTSWDNKNDEVYEALRSPSVRNARNAFDRRVALAIREARQGFRTCAGCQFTNSVRATSCVLCGSSIAQPPKGVLKRWKAKRDDSKPDAKPVVEDIGFANASARQQRVRLRKLWTRQVDSNGHVVWSHDQGAVTHSGFGSYVLQTKTVESLVPDQSDRFVQSPRARDGGNVVFEGRSDENLNVQIAIDVDSPATPVTKPDLSIVDITGLLKGELRVQKISVVDVNQANPSHVPFKSISGSSDGETSMTTQSIVDTANIAKLDFPSKIAQFITSVASLFNDINKFAAAGGVPVSRFLINRAELLSDSIHALALMSPTLSRGAIRVEFVDEQGIDAGGVYREWFLLLNEEIVKPEAGIFTCVDQHEQTFYLNPVSEDMLGEHHLAHFFAAGRLLGRALLEGNVTGFHLALPLLKIILGLPVSFPDLAYFDPEAYRNMLWLLENDDVEMLGLDFTVVQKLPNGKTREIELVPGGSQIDVTDVNKHEYIECKLKYLLFDSVQDQLFAFLRGLYEIVPAELLMVFDSEELDYVLSGSDEIDVDDWEAHTLASRNLALHPAYFNFWKVVRELSSEQRQRLLQYATGSTRVPPGGFSALTSHDGRLCLFTLRGVLANTTYGCLHSHACFNRLDVPMHREIEPMREAVLAAVSSDIVGFTTA